MKWSLLGCCLLLIVSCEKKEGNLSREKAEPLRSLAVRSTDLIQQDPVEVFQRAFWRQPGPGDRILHAERSESVEGKSLQRWQWYLELEPSEALRKTLIVENTFALRPVTSAKFPEKTAPRWFNYSVEGAEQWTSGDGEMTLTFVANKLFATGQGGGFQTGVEPPAPPTGEEKNLPAGRLPANSPPIPD